MTLAVAIQQATEAALGAMDSISEPFTYQEVDSTAYNTELGSVSRQIKGSHPLNGWFTSYKEQEIDGNNVQPKDKRLTILATKVLFTVRLHDYILDHCGTTWEVINFKRPPPRSVYILQIRKP